MANNSCSLIVLNSVPLTIENFIYSNAEVESSIAEFDPAVIAGAGYAENAQVIMPSGGIYSSTEDANTTMPGTDIGGSKFVYDPLARQYTQRLFWNIYYTFSTDEEAYGNYSTTQKSYRVYKSLSDNNLNHALPSGETNNTYWEFVGYGNNLKYTRTDLTAAISIGETIWSDSQQKGFTAIVDIPAGSGVLLPIYTDAGLVSTTSKWTKIGVINPLRILEPSPTQRTTRDLNYTVEFLLDRRFKNLSLWGVTGENVELTIWDSTETQIYNEIHSLTKPAYDYEEWFFDPIEMDDHIVLLDLPWDTQVRVKIEITGTGECGAGGVYPADSLYCGYMDYAPTVKILDSTEEVPTLYDSGQNDVEFGTVTYEVQYKTRVEPVELDLVVDNLIKIKRDAENYGLPSVYIGTDIYKSFQMLGRMPTGSVSLDSSSKTSVNMNITGVI